MKLRLSVAWLRSRCAAVETERITKHLFFRDAVLRTTISELKRKQRENRLVIRIKNDHIAFLDRQNSELELKNAELAKCKSELEWLKRKEGGWL